MPPADRTNGNADNPIGSDHGAMAVGPHADTPDINVDMPLPSPPYVGACDTASAEQETATTIDHDGGCCIFFRENWVVGVVG